MSEDFETAALNETMLQSLKQLEHNLTEQAGEEIVLVAYSKNNMQERHQLPAD